MNCPHCSHTLTDAEIKRLWAQRNASRQTPHAGPGKPVSCACGQCSVCIKRAKRKEGKIR